MKAIFSENVDVTKSAFLNWRTSSNKSIDNFIVMADGFLRSSLELAQICLADNSDYKADALIFPILHNANHGIELYLKAFIMTLNQLLKNSRIERGHNIQQFLQTVKSRIKDYGGAKELKYFNQETKMLQLYIAELFAITKASNKDDKMDFSRYPLNNANINHFYVDELNNVTIDLENFVQVFKNIHLTLDERISYYYYYNLMQK
ncbi:hypothetical protein GCM10007424_00540 [Flavobacterium suaedae]|uniref:HEPN domain-containing protein n=1 Tax=Flavobacterium suaedae TaxID=1767027 RepID=A0ABQ1JEQ6_9FLAO|nr:hypothetical protein [Flavobacterium suaedae]GGB64530.1 hypothetical protein GCM10007424_00540 [Flavobacterium suaedae]